jgi:hypothetical protein
MRFRSRNINFRYLFDISIINPPRLTNQFARCHRMSRECLPSIPKPRKRQPINGLGELEIRGAPLSHILDNTPLPLQTTSSRSPMPSHHGQPRYSDSLRHASGALSDITQDRTQSFTSLFAQRLELDDHAPSFIDCLAGVDHISWTTSGSSLLGSSWSCASAVTSRMTFS